MKGLRTTADFEIALARLNEVQRQAVEQTDGPVLVLAGPGTGKTEILALRIGNILLKTDMKPYNILCLTFTDAGVIAMRTRLLRYLGTTGFQVPVYTFHSFCNEIIATHPDIFPASKEQEPVSDLEKIRMALKLLDTLPATSSLKTSANPHFHAKGIVNFFKKIKQYRITPDDFDSAIEKLKEIHLQSEDYYYKRNTKNNKKGDFKQEESDREISRYDKAREALDLFPSYEEEMRNEGRYDFEDMILWVLSAFRENHELLLRYQEQYQYFLVDEFQDTNRVQKELVDTLADYWGDKANVFVVGDDDQAIYSFQGANVQHLLDFKKQYESTLRLFVLKENYRSNQQILDSSRVLINTNKVRLVRSLENIDKNLISRSVEAKPVKPRILAFDNPLHELTYLIDYIRAAFKEDKDLSQIAVLYRKHRLADDLVALLEKSAGLPGGEKIPYQLKKEENALRVNLVKKFLNLLRMLVYPSVTKEEGDMLIFEILHYEPFRIPVKGINKVFRFAYEKKITAFEIIRSDEFLLQAGAEEILPFQSFVRKFDRWQKTAANETLQHTFETVLYESGFLTLVLEKSEQDFLLQAYSSLFQELKNQTRRNPRLTLNLFLDHLAEMEQFGVELTVTHTIEQKGGVQLLSAHAAKGLEYDKVFVYQCDASAWEKGDHSDGFNIPPTFFLSTGAGGRKDEIFEETRRLFYVCMTRAKSELLLTFSRKDWKGKDRTHSAFIGELNVPEEENVPSLPVEDIDLSRNILTESVLASLTPGPVAEKAHVDSRLVDEILKNYKLSVTHLNNYLKCPRLFYYQDLLRVPAQKNSSTAFGRAVHEALNKIFDRFKKTNVLPGSGEFLDFFEDWMRKEQDGFTDAEFAHRMEKGKLMLKEFYEKFHKDWSPVLLTEYSLGQRNLVVEGVPVTGKLDLVQFEQGRDAVVIDFKTGKPANAYEKLKPGTGEYWRQLVFYKILLDADEIRGYRMIRGELVFIEREDKKDYFCHRQQVSTEEKKAVLEEIQTMYNNIRQHKFEKVDISEKEEKCSNCRFLRICWKD